MANLLFKSVGPFDAIRRVQVQKKADIFESGFAHDISRMTERLIL